MPRLFRAALLLLPKRRLVNQQISPLCRIDDRGTRSCVSRKHDQPPRPLWTHDPLGAHLPPVRQLDRPAPLQLAPQVPLRNAGRPRFVGIEPPRPLVLLERVPDRSPTVLRSERVDRIPVPTSASPSPNLHNLPRPD